VSGIFIGFQGPPQLSERFKVSANREQVVEALARTMVQLNGFEKEKKISVAGKEGLFDGTMRVQIGIGHGPRMIYYKSNKTLHEVINKVLNILKQSLIDFGIRVSYKYFDGKEWRPVRSDEYVVRITLEPNIIGLQVKLLRGLGRIDPEDLASMIIERLGANLKEIGVESPMLERI